MTAERDTLISAAENRRMFDAIAGRYDLLNRLLSLGLDRRWRRRAVRELSPAPGALYLDLGCGTGDLLLELRRQTPTARGVGVDAAMTMVRLAARKIEARGATSACALVAADACALPFADAAFAGALSGFCVRNIERRRLALCELRRVLRPGATAVLLDLTRPRHALLRLGHRLYNRIVVPLAGRCLSRGDAYRYLIDSIEHFPAPGVIVDDLRAAGFGQVRDIPLSGGVVTLFIARRD